MVRFVSLFDGKCVIVLLPSALAETCGLFSYGSFLTLMIDGHFIPVASVM